MREAGEARRDTLFFHKQGVVNRQPCFLTIYCLRWQSIDIFKKTIGQLICYVTIMLKILLELEKIALSVR